MWGILLVVIIHAASHITLGLEEEVFISTPTRPTLDALYALTKLLWRNPRFYYKHTASNFARGRDAHQCLMSSVEIATRPHTDINALLQELRTHRTALANAAGDAYLVPVGHLFDLDAPTNTAGLHIHIGVSPERRPIVYANLAHFLPLLILLAASSPYAGGRYVGPSYRVAASYAIGTLRTDPYYRFQDLILSRRLDTIEIRVFDPVWDLERLRVLLQSVRAIAQLSTARPIDYAHYATLRHQAASVGYTPDLQALQHELRPIYAIPEELLQQTLSDALHAHMRHSPQDALLSTYAHLDHAYRTGRWEPVAPRSVSPSAWRGALGVLGYYVPRLPYMAYKAWAEWRAPIRAGYSVAETVAGEPAICRADS